MRVFFIYGPLLYETKCILPYGVVKAPSCIKVSSPFPLRHPSLLLSTVLSGEERLQKIVKETEELRETVDRSNEKLRGAERLKAVANGLAEAAETEQRVLIEKLRAAKELSLNRVRY